MPFRSPGPQPLGRFSSGLCGERLDHHRYDPTFKPDEGRVTESLAFAMFHVGFRA